PGGCARPTPDWGAIECNPGIAQRRAQPVRIAARPGKTPPERAYLAPWWRITGSSLACVCVVPRRPRQGLKTKRTRDRTRFDRSAKCRIREEWSGRRYGTLHASPGELPSAPGEMPNKG